MGKTTHFVLDQDEKLAKEVSKYPCLQDKSNATYKSKVRKDKARAKNRWNFGKATRECDSWLWSIAKQIQQKKDKI